MAGVTNLWHVALERHTAVKSRAHELNSILKFLRVLLLLGAAGSAVAGTCPAHLRIAAHESDSSLTQTPRKDLKADIIIAPPTVV